MDKVEAGNNRETLGWDKNCKGNAKVGCGIRDAGKTLYIYSHPVSRISHPVSRIPHLVPRISPLYQLIYNQIQHFYKDEDDDDPLQQVAVAVLHEILE